MKKKISIFWFRRDLRLNDNAGLYHALKNNENLLCLFIFDKQILDKLEDKDDPRLTFIYQQVLELKSSLEERAGSLLIKYGEPTKVWKEITSEFNVDTVYTNRDYEPYAISRDAKIKSYLAKKNISFNDFKDQVIFDTDEVLKKDLTPYTVFTPYSKVWKAKILSGSKTNSFKDSTYFKSFASESLSKQANKLFAKKFKPVSLKEMGFLKSSFVFPSKVVKRVLIKNYTENRDFPALNGTSKLGMHFRFGTISIRDKARQASALNETFLNELIWRDFYAMILANFPHVVDGPFRNKYSFIEWRNDEREYELWQKGMTGYPIVDAGMRELNETGHMHNRVRMVVASFLSKHLLIDWKWGEAYFARKLLDFDLASNNGGWQWAAGCGTDAAPYFRIFNPYTQQIKFDKNLEYIRKWVPEFGTEDYPEAIVDHKAARLRCLDAYKKGLEMAEKMAL